MTQTGLRADQHLLTRAVEYASYAVDVVGRASTTRFSDDRYTRSAVPGRRIVAECQSASNFDPRSASNFDPLERRVRAVALAPSELVGVAETARARVGE